MPALEGQTAVVASSAEPVPAFPALRSRVPILVRAPDEVQIGLDDDSVVLGNAHPALRAVLGLLDGCHHRNDLLRFAKRQGMDPEAVDWTLRELARAGLLVESRRGAPQYPGAAAEIRLVGAGPLGAAIAELLVEHVGALHLIDPEPADPATYGRGILGSGAEALRARLGSSHARISVWNHWSKPQHLTPTLTVLAGETAEPDRVITDTLLRADQPHLLARSSAAGAVVGPLVIPGATACVSCADLTRRDRDPEWPNLLAQLCRSRSTASPVLTRWAAATTAVQVLSWVRGGRAETTGATLELPANDLSTRWRPWQLHAGCGCHWRVPAQ